MKLEFRVWDNINKYYYDLYKDIFYIRDDGKVYFETYLDGLRDVSDRVNIEQYTGAKDKNGVRIFEGDLLRDAVNNDLYKVCWDSGNLTWVVRGVLGWSFNLSSLYEDVMEVIGNIHQNKELLK